MRAGRHRYRQDSAMAWRLAYIVAGAYLGTCLTYVVTS